jgi:hypothetical protein
MTGGCKINNDEDCTVVLILPILGKQPAICTPQQRVSIIQGGHIFCDYVLKVFII